MRSRKFENHLMRRFLDYARRYDEGLSNGDPSWLLDLWIVQMTRCRNVLESRYYTIV